MKNKCCLSPPLYWIPKISFTLIVSNICKIKLIVYKVIVLFSTTTEIKGICTSMLNFKLGHKKEYFFLFIGFRLKIPKSHPTFPFLSVNRVPSKLYYTQLVELVTKFMTHFNSNWQIQIGWLVSVGTTGVWSTLHGVNWNSQK